MPVYLVLPFRYTGFMRKFLQSITVVLMLGHIFITPAQAASPTFYLDPSSDSATVGDEFSVDIMIDSDGEEVLEARAVLTYDPDIIQVSAVSHSNIFCTYPDSGYDVDNSTGQLILTGFCNDDNYSTSGDADIFGRVTFQGRGNGEGEVEFAYDGTDDEDVTYMQSPGSPPLKITLISPTGGSYSVSGGATTPDDDSGLPSTGLFDNLGITFGISLLVLSFLVLVLDSLLPRILNWFSRRGQRTIVV